MSETGAIDREQLIKRLAELVPETSDPNWGKHDYIRSFLCDLEDDGYRIVPADAVCIDRATADTAAEACAITATRIDNLIRLGQDQDGDTEAAERYRATAAVLRGGGGG